MGKARELLLKSSSKVAEFLISPSHSRTILEKNVFISGLDLFFGIDARRRKGLVTSKAPWSMV